MSREASESFRNEICSLDIQEQRGSNNLCRKKESNRLIPYLPFSVLRVIMLQKREKPGISDSDIVYVQARWVAEQLANKASARDLPAAIYSAGFIFAN